MVRSRGFRLLDDPSGGLVGFCWTKIHRDTVPALGEIYVIAIDPDHHGRGLGKPMTLAGLEWPTAQASRSACSTSSPTTNRPTPRTPRSASLDTTPTGPTGWIDERHHGDRPRSILPRCADPAVRPDPGGAAELLDGELRYRLDQIWEGLHARGADIDELTNVPKALRRRLVQLPSTRLHRRPNR
ncbi:MAG: hypothetical protein R2695_12180 [Acidimicrobiales bacterium]